CSPPFVGAVSTGSTDTTGGLTSALDTLSGTYAPDSSQAYATAAANEANGTLHEAAYGGCGYIRGG
ncbi:MAG: hypothetical protein ABI040_09690, partial [Rhodoferax sp.]